MTRQSEKRSAEESGSASRFGQIPLRRKWTPAQKLQIVLETLQSDRKLARIYRREGVSPNLVYQWRRPSQSSRPSGKPADGTTSLGPE